MNYLNSTMVLIVSAFGYIIIYLSNERIAIFRKFIPTSQ